MDADNFPSGDRLTEIFRRQRSFMDLLCEAGRFPEYPVDISSKEGQDVIRDVGLHFLEEFFEALHILRNRRHKQTDDRDVNIMHFREELADVLHLFVEFLIVCGISEDLIFAEFVQKNEKNRQRILNGY